MITEQEKIEKRKSLYKIKKEEMIQKPFLVKEAYKWITLKVRLRGICSLIDISNLIYYFDVLGGSQRELNGLRTGVQLEKMWLYCQEELKKDKKPF